MFVMWYIVRSLWPFSSHRLPLEWTWTLLVQRTINLLRQLNWVFLDAMWQTLNDHFTRYYNKHSNQSLNSDYWLCGFKENPYLMVLQSPHPNPSGNSILSPYFPLKLAFEISFLPQILNIPQGGYGYLYFFLLPWQEILVHCTPFTSLNLNSPFIPLG